MSNVNVDVREDSIAEVRLSDQSSILIRFEDGSRFELPIKDVPIDATRVDWSSLSVSSNGEQMIVAGVKGDLVPIDGGVLRCLVDKTYADKVRASLDKLRLSRAELLKKKSPPSADWLSDQPSDMRRDSWK